jgi:hypothetical protein
MTRRIVCLFAIAAFATALTGAARVQAADEPSVKGTWVGYLNVAGNKVKFTTTLRADGTYKTVMEYAAYISVEKGKYTYSDGVLETEPDSGITGTYTVKFDGNNMMTVKGAGLSLTYKRQ